MYNRSCNTILAHPHDTHSTAPYAGDTVPTPADTDPTCLPSGQPTRSVLRAEHVSRQQQELLYPNANRSPCPVTGTRQEIMLDSCGHQVRSRGRRGRRGQRGRGVVTGRAEHRTKARKRKADRIPRASENSKSQKRALPSKAREGPGPVTS